MLSTIEGSQQCCQQFHLGVLSRHDHIIGVGLYLKYPTLPADPSSPYSMKVTLGRMMEKASDGALTPSGGMYSSLQLPLAPVMWRVSGAIVIGGPGAVFWMWVSALLGMCTKFASCRSNAY